MRNVITHVFAGGVTADDVYEKICDFGRYPALTKTVENVVVHPRDADGSVVSEWTVHFRNGLLKWTERDTFTPATRSLSFEQLSGDFAVFTGSWRVVPNGDGAVVTFSAQFDLGIPTLADILDPVAEATLRENILVILHGLLGNSQEVPQAEVIPAQQP